MSAYNTIDTSRQGLEEGLLGPKESWVCKESDGIEFGAPVMGYRGDADGGYNFHNDTAKIVLDGDYQADNVINGTVNGVAISEVTWSSDHDTTVALVVAAYALLSGVEAILDPLDGDSRTILIQSKGSANITTQVITLGSGQPTPTITYGSSQIFVGVSLFSQKYPGEYEQYDTINVMVSGGKLNVPVTATVEANNEAYIDNSGADLGSFSSAGKEIAAKYRGNATSGNLVILEVTGKTEMTYFDNF